LARSKNARSIPECLIPFLDKDIDDVPFAILDTETTGFHGRARVHQIGVTTLLNRETALEEDSINIFINIFDENFIEHEMVKEYNYDDLYDECHFKDIVEEFEKYIEGKLIVAHNESYDRRMIEYEYELIDRTRPDILMTKFFDTRRIAKLVLGKDLLGDRSLDWLSEYLGYFMVDDNDRHEALPDAILTSNCLGALFSMYQELGKKKVSDLIEDIGIKYG